VSAAAGTTVIGMIGVANKTDDYDARDERLLATFAGQVAVRSTTLGCMSVSARLIAELQELR